MLAFLNMKKSISFKISFMEYKLGELFSPFVRENYQSKASPNSGSQGATYTWDVPISTRVLNRISFIYCLTTCEGCELKRDYAFFSF